MQRLIANPPITKRIYIIHLNKMYTHRQLNQPEPKFPTRTSKGNREREILLNENVGNLRYYGGIPYV